eukprot:scaffold536218_cov18-Prasinocladus_malaysianus.AAC.1
MLLLLNGVHPQIVQDHWDKYTGCPIHLSPLRAPYLNRHDEQTCGSAFEMFLDLFDAFVALHTVCKRTYFTPDKKAMISSTPELF